METSALRELTLKVIAVARDAGALIIQNRRKGTEILGIKTKHPHDFVTDVDKASETFLIGALSGLLPQAGFIIEEGGAGYDGQEYAWVVDPLDGTTNFIHGFGSYCVSIALRSRQELLLGVVFDPTRGECFYSWRGAGHSYINGVPMGVTETKNLDDALVVAELPYNSQGYRECGLNLISSFIGRVQAIRMTGSAALAICYVAAGRVDAWMEAFLGRWDFSAAALILEESGGKVTDFLGRSTYLDSHHIVATNGHLHGLVLDVVSRRLPEGL